MGYPWTNEWNDEPKEMR